MQLARKAWSVLAVTLLVADAAPAADLPEFAASNLATPRVGPAPLPGKCINLANTLEAPNEGEWGHSFRDEDADIVRKAGFSTLRVPVNFAAHAAERAPYTIDPTFLARARHVVDVSRKAGLNIIVDLHHYEGLSTDPEAHRDRLAGLWRQVAQVFRDEPANVWFEISNEPHDKLTNANLLETLTPALATIRETNPTRVVVIGGENWSGVGSLETLHLPDDRYVIPTIHYYEPFEFTHQGASFINPPPPFGRRFGGPRDVKQLNEMIAKTRSYMERTGRALFVGEFGAIETIPLDQRITYYRTVSSAFASLGVPTCAWGYPIAFSLRKDGKWLPGMLEAITAPK